jgi:cyclic-di-AMP phosphodiesterase PgpH
MPNQTKRRSGLWPSIQKFGRTSLRFLKREQLLLPPRIASIAGMFSVALILTIIAGYKQLSSDIGLSNGIVQSDIVASRDFSIIDEEATERLREQAAAQVPSVFEYNPRLYLETVSNLERDLQQLEQQFNEGLRQRFGHVDLSRLQPDSPDYKLFLKQFAEEYTAGSLKIDENTLRLLASHRFSPDLKRSLARVLDGVMKNVYIPDNAEAGSQRIMYKNMETGEQGKLRGYELINLIEAERRLQVGINSIRDLKPEERELLAAMVKPFITPNLRYSESLTEVARGAARAKVGQVGINYRQNQIIARRGDPMSPRIQNAMRYSQQAAGSGRRAIRLLGIFIIIFALVLGLKKFSQRTTLRQRLGTARAFSLICFTLILQAVLIRFGMEVSRKVATTFSTTGSGIQYEFLIPFAGAALIMVFLLDAVSAQVCALLVCLFTGLISNGDFGLMIYAVLSGTAATYGVKRYQHRNSITLAGTIIGLMNALAVVTVLLIGNQSAPADLYFYNILYGIGGGLLTAAFVSLVIPINESLFDILTDVKLLELSNMDLPLLRDMGVITPGTQQHSMVVSSLAESAAEAIEANGLLVRVGCYYHDIGKMMAPDMFIENQGGRDNPHDHMEPKRSASVIVGHVKKGILMAQEAGLPTQIVDLIPQHHGTRKLHYFYNKALEEVSKTGEPVNEDHYRYPGPKPQSREAAILMLADCAEAAARSLDDPTPENIREIIKRITEDVIADGQLEECEMTMREFNQVRENLIETLCNIYHHRIKYPGFNVHTQEETEGGVAAEQKEPAEAGAQSLAAAAGSVPMRSGDEDSASRLRNSGKLPPKP